MIDRPRPHIEGAGPFGGRNTPLGPWVWRRKLAYRYGGKLWDRVPVGLRERLEVEPGTLGLWRVEGCSTRVVVARFGVLKDEWCRDWAKDGLRQAVEERVRLLAGYEIPEEREPNPRCGVGCVCIHHGPVAVRRCYSVVAQCRHVMGFTVQGKVVRMANQKGAQVAIAATLDGEEFKLTTRHERGQQRLFIEFKNTVTAGQIQNIKEALESLDTMFVLIGG